MDIVAALQTCMFTPTPPFCAYSTLFSLHHASSATAHSMVSYIWAVFFSLQSFVPHAHQEAPIAYPGFKLS
jgi:hypothetical protein